LKPRDRAYKVFDTDGLFLLIKPTGSRGWRQRYRFHGKEKLLSVGAYPEIGLSDARERGAQVRKQAANGVDPSVDRRTQARAAEDQAVNTFKAVALAWHGRFSKQWSADHAEKILQRLETNAFPWIGNSPISAITSQDVLSVIERMANRGAYDTGRRVLQLIKKVFKWAVVRELLATSPAAHLEPKDALPKIRVEHRAAIKDPMVFGALLRAIDAYQGGFVVRCALQLLSLTWVRPVELRNARWSEFVLDGKEPTWRIPAEKMKMGGEHHLVPLSKQAVAHLREIQPLTGADGRGLVFPGVRNAARPLSENTLNAAMRTMGFTQDQHTSHGFRGTASTLLNEQQWNPDAIEIQLAHMERDESRESYNAAKHLPLRRNMMQAWADYLDTLKALKTS
jgi:integrase